MSIIVLIAAASLTGAWALKPLHLPRDFEGGAYRLLAGLLLCAVFTAAVGSLSLRANQLVMFAIAGGGLTLELARRRGSARPAWRMAPHRRFSRLELACLAAVGGALLLSFLAALAPATSWDAAVAHLALPSDYAREGRMLLLKGNAYSVYPHLMHSLYTFCYYQGGERPVMLLSWLFGALACAFTYCLGKRLMGRTCGLIAAAALATAPIFIDQTGAVSLDLAFAGVTAAALTALYAWRDERQPAYLLLAAFAAGASCGIRHTGYLVCVLLAIAVLMLAGARRFRWFGAFAGVALLAALPWLLRSALLAGNPFYPFLTQIFPAEGVADPQMLSLGSHPTTAGSDRTSLKALITFPWWIIMRPDRFDGWSKSPGGIVLFLGLPGLLVGGRRVWWMGAFSIAGGVCMFYFQQFARYLLPFFVPMMAVAGTVERKLPVLRRGLAVLLPVAFAFGLAIQAAAVHFKIPAALGLESREDYLARRVERYPAFVWVNENIRHDRTVLTLDPRSYYIEGRTYQNFENLAPLRGRSTEEQVAWLNEEGIKYVLFPEAYLRESPIFAAPGGLLHHINTWREHPEYFLPVKVFELPRRDGDGTERVELLEIRYEKLGEDRRPEPKGAPAFYPGPPAGEG